MYNNLHPLVICAIRQTFITGCSVAAKFPRIHTFSQMRIRNMGEERKKIPLHASTDRKPKKKIRCTVRMHIFEDDKLLLILDYPPGSHRARTAGRIQPDGSKCVLLVPLRTNNLQDLAHRLRHPHSTPQGRSRMCVRDCKLQEITQSYPHLSARLSRGVYEAAWPPYAGSCSLAERCV